VPKRLYRAQSELPLAARYVAEGEMRISQQKELIARLKKAGRPTDRAESVLRGYEGSLLQLLNHLELMQELTSLGGN
jgi:hypothetical protein